MEFVSPPPEAKGERSKRWQEIVTNLKQHRGEWALVGNFSPGVATHIRRGKYAAFMEGDNVPEEQAHGYMSRYWEITTRKTSDGKRNDIYIRYIG